MAKARPHRTNRNQRKGQKLLKAAEPKDPSLLLVQAAELLHRGQPELALLPANRALSLLSSENGPSSGALPALSLLGEIQVELGDTSAALKTFEAATVLDPNGHVPEEHGGGAEKFMWLAQLCETGGRDSIRWYQKGVAVLEENVEALQKEQDESAELREKQQELSGALCAMVEVWMTDLSIEAEAEQQCEELIGKALKVTQPPAPATLQALASVRLSQSRLNEAQAALTQSMAQWEDLPPEHPGIPDFALRISLSRLLMEADMEDEALGILEGLIGDDDESVEAWYLGGWCLWLLAQRNEGNSEEVSGNEGDEERQGLLLSSREWLRNCLKLFSLLGYEDDRLKEHAVELVEGLDKEVGGAEIEDIDDNNAWVDEDEEIDHDGGENLDVGSDKMDIS